jgi:hypothetical protein
VIRDHRRAVRRVTRLYDFYLDDDDSIRKIRRVLRHTNKKKKKVPKEVRQIKYGFQVPRSPKDALELDKINGNDKWKLAMKKEVDSLIRLECFEFKDKGYEKTLSKNWQWTKLFMVFDVKNDHQHKARLVAGGHLMEAIDVKTYSSTVKGISVRLLQVIAHKQKLELLCGDIGNAFVNAKTTEKVWAVAGPEFGEELEGKIVIIIKALYGLKSSAECWHSHFSDTLRSLGFIPTRYDNDVWIRKHKDGKSYEYVCTHVDDFQIASKDPTEIMKQIQDIYLVKPDSIGPPDYYLGNDYKKDDKGRYAIGCKKYIKESLRRVQAKFGNIPKQSVPMANDDHPEMDASPLLDDDGHRDYQMLMGILNWVVVIGRMDIAYAFTSLSRFSIAPRKGHLDRALKVFGYLKKYPGKRIIIDSRDPIYEGSEEVYSEDLRDEFEELYPDAAEDIDPDLPDGLVDEMAITVMVDSDHAHDKLTRRSVTGIIIFVGRTPVYFSSKRQTSVETSTYSAEFCAMKTTCEETIAIRYMLRSLGVKVTRPTIMFGDNMAVIQNTTLSDSILKKKHVACSYHKTRECVAAGIVHPIKIDTAFNISDMLTKSLPRLQFHGLLDAALR